MKQHKALQAALLGIGLEDLIPIPEALSDPEVIAAVGGSLSVEDLSTALIGLLRLGSISVWIGHWRSDPRRASTAEAEQLLSDANRYYYETEADGTERVYFANVDNIS